MPVTQLDPNTALIVIDLQQGIVAMPVAHPIAEVIHNSVQLLDAFRRHHLPIVLVNVDAPAPGRTEAPPRVREFPAGWSDLIPELNQQPTDHLVTKKSWGAFTNTDLYSYLKSENVTQVVVCGVATTAGVESTAREAHGLGFHVTMAIDAMTDMSLEAHVNSIARIFPRMSETGTTEQIITLLDSTRT
jgi:nicotinamidase-related amidase